MLLITVVSYLGTFGGIGYLSSATSQLLVVIISLFFYFIGLKNSKLSSKLTDHIDAQTK
jgi:amino acid transporter